jgi:hypothetical protein
MKKTISIKRLSVATLFLISIITIMENNSIQAAPAETKIFITWVKNETDRNLIFVFNNQMVGIRSGTKKNLKIEIPKTTISQVIDLDEAPYIIDQQTREKLALIGLTHKPLTNTDQIEIALMNPNDFSTIESWDAESPREGRPWHYNIQLVIKEPIENSELDVFAETGRLIYKDSDH